MWKILQESPSYFIKFTSESDSNIILLTNYVKIWSCTLSTKQFLDVLKDSNEGLELDNEDDFITIGTEMLLNPKKLKRVHIVEQNDSSIDVTMTKSHGFPVKLNLSFKISTNKCLFKEVIQPLLLTINDLKASQTELRKELTKKDKEIEEYKCEGGEIALRHLKTVYFNDTRHMERHSLYEQNFEYSNIPECLLEPVQLEEIKRETQPLVPENVSNNTTVANNIKTEVTEVPSIKTESPSGVTAKTEHSNNVNNVENPIPSLSVSETKILLTTPIKNEPLSQSDNVKTPTSPVCDIKPKIENDNTPRKRQKRKLNY